MDENNVNRPVSHTSLPTLDVSLKIPSQPTSFSNLNPSTDSPPSFHVTSYPLSPEKNAYPISPTPASTPSSPSSTRPMISTSCPFDPSSSPSSSSSLPPAYQPPSRRLFNFLYIHPRFSGVHFLMYLIACFFTIAFFVFLGSMTTNVVYFITKYEGEIGRTIGYLSTYDEILSIPAVLFWGLISDRIGRRWVYSLGFSIMGLAMFVYPLAKNVYPQLLLARLLFATGAAACSSMLTAVLADCAGRLRGRIAAVVGISTGLGAVFSAFVLIRLPSYFSSRPNISNVQGIQYSFYITASLGVLFACLFFLFSNPTLPVSSSSSSSSSSTLSSSSTTLPPQPPVSSSDRCSLFFKMSFQNFKRGFLLAKDWRILVTYAAGMVARGNTVVMTNFIPLWVTFYAVQQGKCELKDVTNGIETQTQCHWAYTQASKLTGITNTMLLVGAPIWGLLSDQYGITEVLPFRHSKLQSPTLPILLSCLVATLGYALLSFQTVPEGWALILICIVIGLGMIGTVITSAAMISSSYIDPHLRGAVSGVYSFFGGIGIILCSSLGGVLFDVWPLAPFALVGSLHVLVAFLSILAMWYGPTLPPYQPKLTTRRRFFSRTHWKKQPEKEPSSTSASSEEA